MFFVPWYSVKFDKKFKDDEATIRGQFYKATRIQQTVQMKGYVRGPHHFLIE